MKVNVDPFADLEPFRDPKVVPLRDDDERFPPREAYAD